VSRIVGSETFYIALCSGCRPALPIPFGAATDMGAWVGAHLEATGHTIVVWKEER
jgi:hypothetical protein